MFKKKEPLLDSSRGFNQGNEEKVIGELWFIILQEQGWEQSQKEWDL